MAIGGIRPASQSGPDTVDLVVLPRLCDLVMRNPHPVLYRKWVVGSAQGCVLEIWHRIGLEPVFRGAPVREILCETTAVWRLSQLHDLSPWQPCLAGSERWGESRLGDSPKVISDLLAAFRGSLINKAPRAEHLNRTQEVGGSNPLVSTNAINDSEQTLNVRRLLFSLADHLAT